MRAAPRAGGHAGRRLAWLVSAVVGLAAAGAVRAQPAGVALIVPGEAIGPVRLGMSAAEVRGASGRLPCEIAVAFAEDRATRLETNCGVAYQTAEGLTVGLDGSRIWWIHGEPDLVVPSNLPGTRADWLVYRGEGIGFRIVHAPTGSLIQAIAIFRGTEPGARRRPGVPPPVVPPAPPPALGD
jgi:hypothetical protein